MRERGKEERGKEKESKTDYTVTPNPVAMDMVPYKFLQIRKQAVPARRR